jgi:leader peptidase (prepilin peptidase)/N-methyltransferase
MLELLMTLPVLLWLVTVFALGLGAGSFIGQAVYRLPFEKSVFWPTKSHCMSCLKPLRMFDNIPVIGYLRLRGQCRHCGQTFSSKYMWVELITGLAFVAVFLIEILPQSTGGPAFLKPWFHTPGLRFPFLDMQHPLPPLKVWAFWAAHCLLICLLFTASLIDAEHRIIPTTITYPGTVAGIIISMLMPWPWPSDASAVPNIPGIPLWIMPHYEGLIPHGVQMWPAIGPPPAWAPAGTWQMGLLNSLVGAAAGMLCGRGLKFIYESARGKEALGLGDADLLMMIGAFLGWQVAVLSLPLGALMSLVFVIPNVIYQWIRKRPIDPLLPFGPGIAMAAIATWLLWPILNEAVRMSFDWQVTATALGIPAVCLAACGLILRRRG